MRNWFTLRKPVPPVQAVLLGVLCVACCAIGWWAVTYGPNEERLVGPLTLPSPAETFAQFHDLWFEFELTRNTLTTLKRVSLGFLLAMAVGIPVGVLAGCFTRLNAFLSPLVMFGRNIPLAAVIPLMLFFFGATELNKIMFIFIATVAFVIADSARAVADVAERYVDTAYTLGANRWQTIIKVLVPLAAPTIFSSCRLLFGLAFGYIMLAESVKLADEEGGLGYQILVFQRRGLREHIYLIILIIPLVALLIDQFLYWIQRQLFPHLYGGDGILRDVVRFVMHGWEDLKSLVFPRKAAIATVEPPPPAKDAGA
jgi:NitT/TauT family transport system permease protein